MMPYADSIHIIIPKRIRLGYTEERIIQLFSDIKKQFFDFKRFSKINIDNCIKPFIYPFSELVSYCEYARGIISMDSFGGVSFCAFDKPFTIVNNSLEFITAVKNRYKTCLEKPVKRCPFIYI